MGSRETVKEFVWKKPDGSSAANVSPHSSDRRWKIEARRSQIEDCAEFSVGVPRTDYESEGNSKSEIRAEAEMWRAGDTEGNSGRDGARGGGGRRKSETNPKFGEKIGKSETKVRSTSEPV
jgi:hypothetical protein